MLPNKELGLLPDDQLHRIGAAAGGAAGGRLLRRPHGDGEGRLPVRSGADGKPAGGPGSHRLPHRIQGDSIEYTVYCWATPENWWGAYLALGEHLRDAFREYGVEMTYNHLNVHIIENQS